MQNPSQYKIPNWFLNRQKDYKDGKYSQVNSICIFDFSFFKDFFLFWFVEYSQLIIISFSSEKFK